MRYEQQLIDSVLLPWHTATVYIDLVPALSQKHINMHMLHIQTFEDLNHAIKPIIKLYKV